MKPAFLLVAASLALSLLHLSPVTVHAAPQAKPAAKKTATKKTAAKKTAAPQRKAAPVRTAAKSKIKGKPAQRVAAVRSAAPAALAGTAENEGVSLLLDEKGLPQLGSSAFFIVNPDSGEVLLERNAATAVPIASITKLMTAMVVLDARQNLAEPVTVSNADIDTLKRTGSRLTIGTVLSREEMLQLALMSSENRAASALARHYPGGRQAFIEAMNIKARLLGLWHTRFHDSTGLDPRNISSPHDLAKMVAAAASYPLIREFSTATERYVDVDGKLARFGNTNGLVKNPDWSISVSKTGYISEAGRCLVMQTWLDQKPVVMVLMDSSGRYTRTADAMRVRQWLELQPSRQATTIARRSQG